MHKFIVTVAALIMLIALSTAVLAVSPSQQECEAAGGTFERNQGTVTCTFQTSDPVGNSESSGGRSQTVDTTEEDKSKGTLQNDPQFEETSECTGPGKGSSTAQCP